jgi:hypothetical protein
MVFEGEVVYVFSVPFDVIHNCLVTKEKIELCLEPVVFFVDEVNLGIKFLDDLLIVLLEILHRQFFVVLATLVQLAQPQDFCVAHFNTFFELLNSHLEPRVCFFEILTAFSYLLRSFVGSPQLLSPFLISDGGSSHRVALGRFLSFCVLTVQLVVHLHNLLSSSSYVMWKSNAV